MTAHIATLALRDAMPHGPCDSCDRLAVRRKQATCRHSEPLNGRDAAAEFARRLLPAVRAAVLSPRPAPPVLAAVSRTPVVVAARPEGTAALVTVTACSRCHEDAGYTKNKCNHCGVKRGRRVSRVRHYGAKESA